MTNAPVHALVAKLENSLKEALESRPVSLDAIATRQAEAEKTLEAFAVSPLPERLDAVYDAHAALGTGKALLERFSDAKAWEARLKSTWAVSHFKELVELLERMIHERTSRRPVYRKAAAAELGRLTTAIVNAEGEGAAEDAIEKLNQQLAAIEDDLSDREERLRTASAEVERFKKTNGVEPGSDAYGDRRPSLYQLWQDAYGYARRIDFEPSVAHPTQKSVTTPSVRVPSDLRTP